MDLGVRRMISVVSGLEFRFSLFRVWVLFGFLDDTSSLEFFFKGFFALGVLCGVRLLRCRSVGFSSLLE